MKKQIITAIFSLSLLFVSCNKSKNETKKNITDGLVTYTTVDFEKNVVSYNKKIDGYEGVTVIKPEKSKSRNIATIDLSEFADKDVYVEFECDLKVENKSADITNINWIINEPANNLPQIASAKAQNGKWTSFTGKAAVNFSGPRQFFLSGVGIQKENVTVYIRNFKLKIYCDDVGGNKIPQKGWMEEPSLAKSYSPYFDYFGLCGPRQGVFDNADITKGIAYQASCFTMENEFKPDFMFAWQNPSSFVDFTGENGKTVKVPANTPVLGNVGAILSTAKNLGIKMRGHVLVWHSQTPDWFFRENFGDTNASYVDKETMNARLEWYIKTILEYIKDWETKNNDGEHIVITWDVVNEAASDNPSTTHFLRTDSNWYRIYESDEFIVNAFRFANKYAPEDVLLAYNDYSCSVPAKCNAICKIIDDIQSCPDARIDVLGMQTHVGMNTLVTGHNSFETALQKFTAKGLDVQITEMDIGLDGQSYNSERQKSKYKEFFTMFLNNRKTSTQHGVRGVTLWGTVDERSWISAKNGIKQHPLIFDGNYTCKPAFYGVLEAVQEFEASQN